MLVATERPAVPVATAVKVRVLFPRQGSVAPAAPVVLAVRADPPVMVKAAAVVPAEMAV